MDTYVILKDLAIIIVFAKLFGILARKCKAPQVVGELIAGIVLGPSVLGLVQQSDFLAQMAEIGVILLILFLIFVSNVLSVGQCRFLLENRTYRQVKMGRLAFVWRARRWKNVMFIMLKKSVFLFLWDMTIIGGIIKRYSYRMIRIVRTVKPFFCPDR